MQATFPSSNPQVVIATSGTMAQAEDWTLKLQTTTLFFGLVFLEHQEASDPENVIEHKTLVYEKQN